MSKQLVAVLLVLALPIGGWFYWQKQQQAKRRAAMKAAAAAQAASSAGMFTGSTPAPAPAANDAPPAAPAGAAQAAASPAAAPQQMANAAAPMTASAAPAAQPTQDAPAAAVPAETPVSTGAVASLFAPKAMRDPMQSVAEHQYLEMIRTRETMGRELAARAAKDAKLREMKKRPAIESQVVLQGIMEIQGRLTALVNGEMVSKGDSIKGARVVNISQVTVTFEYKGKRFNKSVRTKVK